MGDDFSFDKLYTQMRQVAVENPRLSTEVAIDTYRAELNSGLWVVFYITVSHVWHLSLYRLGEYPSHREVKAVKKSFKVPGDALVSKKVLGAWRVIKFEYPEPGQSRLFEVGPVDKAGANQ